MRHFDTFGEYMFDLLFAPLKKGRRTVNQFAIFFRVIGREFDDLRAVILRVRDEANVASASEIMLPVHGQDRDMSRLEGEGAEAYRTRLSMKGIISRWSGTRQGIQYVLTALGYENSSIMPVYPHDAERWAEFIVNLGIGNANAVKNFYAIFSEIQRVKEGSSKVAAIVFSMKPIYAYLRLGSSVGTVVQLGIPQDIDRYDFQRTVYAGGTGSIRASLPVPEDPSPPSATTILRTGGVCTIISNLSKGE